MKSVLSIQSHVVHGYVGGKAAIFPLQTQGWDVDNINTVNFSNHTGYGTFRGNTLASEQLEDLFQGLEDISARYDAVLTGYIPNAELIGTISLRVSEWKKRENILYLLDPVMGDEGFIYVDKSCINAYKKALEEKNVDILTPNQFELELLVDTKIRTNEDLKNAIRKLHERYKVGCIIVTSIYNLEGLADDMICCAASSNDNGEVELFQIPKIESYFTGVGDLFSALLLDKFYRNAAYENRLSRSVNQVLTIMVRILELTHKMGVESYCSEHNLPTDESSIPQGIINNTKMKHFELRIIEGKEFYFYDDEGIFISHII